MAELFNELNSILKLYETVDVLHFLRYQDLTSDTSPDTRYSEIKSQVTKGLI